jgi:hypothetical protein
MPSCRLRSCQWALALRRPVDWLFQVLCEVITSPDAWAHKRIAAGSEGEKWEAATWFWTG